MFGPGDPRFQEILDLAEQAERGSLAERQRPRWRELVGQLLGDLRQDGSPGADRRKHLRAAAELDVDILEPDEMASLATSTIGSGGISIRIAEVVPVGTVLALSIQLKHRKVPLLVNAQVVWSKPGELGAAFVDLDQSDREMLEGAAVHALVAPG
jgi:hypothetical protein